MIDLAKFELETLAYEVRFNDNWMHFDRSGSIWTEMARKFPSMRIVTGQPAQTSFAIAASIQLQLQHNRLNVVAFNPVDLEVTRSAADRLTELTLKHFGLNTLSRVGLRLTYYQPHAEAASSTNDVLGLLRLHSPSGKHFGFEGQPGSPSLHLRWETGTRGILLRLNAEPRRISFQPPLDLAGYISPIEKDLNGLIVDVDTYSTGQIAPGSFRPSDLIDDTQRVVRRDLPGFIAQLTR